MKHFFEDVWNDLRDKRLWPVAALLVVGLVALPVFLSEKRKEPPPAPSASAAKPEALPAVEVSDDTKLASDLNAFKSKDPFKPGSGVKSLTHDTTSLVSSSSSSSGGAPPSAALGGGGGRGGGASAASGGSSGGGGSAGTPSGGGGGGGGSAPAPRVHTKRVNYSYVADVTFGRAGGERRYRGLRRLEMLPSGSSPLLVFLGATRNGGDAVFLVDSGLRQAGEGHCQDSACSVLSIGPGSEHRFKDDDGHEYVLVIDGIRRVKVGATSSRHKAGTASGSREARDERRRGLISSLLVDTQTVTTGAASSAPHKGR